MSAHAPVLQVAAGAFAGRGATVAAAAALPSSKTNGSSETEMEKDS